MTVPIPSVSRPLGVHLWPLFDRAFTYMTGYPTDEFQYLPGRTPLASFKETVLALMAYYGIIFIGREIMKKREPFKLRKVFIVHNLLLSSMSAILLGLFMEQLVPTIWRKGLKFAFLNREGGWTQPLVVLYYVTYITKYIEFTDTLFLVLKKKPLTFLHTYHHGATAFLVWTQLLGRTPVSWVVISLNLAVHVVMYWYYTQCGRGIKVWWKKYITVLQITQFVLDLGFVYYASYLFSTNGYPGYEQKTAKEITAVFSGVTVLTSYLFLFIAFYLSTYKAYNNRRRTPRRRQHATMKMAISGENVPVTPLTTSAIANVANATAVDVPLSPASPARLGMSRRRSSLRSICSSHCGDFEHSWHHHMEFPTA